MAALSGWTGRRIARVGFFRNAIPTTGGVLAGNIPFGVAARLAYNLCRGCNLVDAARGVHNPKLCFVFHFAKSITRTLSGK